MIKLFKDYCRHPRYHLFLYSGEMLEKFNYLYIGNLSPGDRRGVEVFLCFEQELKHSNSESFSGLDSPREICKRSKTLLKMIDLITERCSYDGRVIELKDWATTEILLELSKRK